MAQQKLNDVEAVRETLGRDAVDGIVDKAYAIKGMYYKIKLGYRTTVLETMKKANQIFIKGAKDVLIPKNITEQMEISMLDKNEQKVNILHNHNVFLLFHQDILFPIHLHGILYILTIELNLLRNFHR